MVAVRGKPTGIGVHALVEQPLALLQPDPHLLRHARILCTGRQRALGPAIPLALLAILLAILVHPSERTQPLVIMDLGVVRTTPVSP